jgi:hypothetical protein
LLEVADISTIEPTTIERRGIEKGHLGRSSSVGPWLLRFLGRTRLRVISVVFRISHLVIHSTIFLLDFFNARCVIRYGALVCEVHVN